METQFARGGLRDPRVGETSFRDWHDRWWDARVVEPHTLRGDGSSIKNHVMPYWADWEMRAITRMDVQSWIRSLMDKGAGAAAIKRAYNLTSSIMRAAVDDDVIAVSPCRSIDLPQIAVKPPQWFTPDQAQSVLDELPTVWRTMCLLGFYTGLRWGELSGLHRHRIDQRRSRLFVVEVNTTSGIKEYPKSSKSRREVPLPPHVLEALERHIHRLDRDAVVFTTLTKGRAGRLLNDGNWRRQTWWPTVDSAHYFDDDGEQQLVPHYPPHSMRHTCASWLVQKGVSLYEVQHLLGHESFQTTQRYAHLQPDAHKAVLGAWERMEAPLTIAA
ncbi:MULTISPECIES: tyrosine-type recombinase/integrase [Streptomyces]|uniref:tyrosine-type recombinase/integrase n=1 Tax=Streptomyces TaxID=1883 RepID=UPI001EEFE80C|nr:MULTISPECIES: site-specific integrase [Streptomyces]